MIKKLYEEGYFDYKNYILDNLKSLSLSTTEAIILIKLLDSYKNSCLFNPEEIRSKMNIRKDTFETALANLLERKIYFIYLTYDNDIASEALSLDGFFELVENLLNNNQSFDENETHSIIMTVQEAFNRVLSSNELDILTSLIQEDRYVKADFIKAIDNINNAKRLLTIKTLSNELTKLKSAPQKKKDTPEYVKNFIKSVK